MAKLSASVFVAVLWLVFVSGSLAKWTECVLDIPYPCAGAGNEICRIPCETNVGSDELMAYQCKPKQLPSRIYIGVCHCIYACPPVEAADMLSSVAALSPADV